MKKKITSMACIAALLITASQPITAEGKNISQELSPAKQISKTVNLKSVNRGGQFKSSRKWTGSYNRQSGTV